MAKQKSIIKFEGKLGEVSMVKTREGGFSARKRAGGSDINRIMTDPKFQRSRENLAEFQRAVRATSLIRYAFRLQLPGMIDSRFSSRLNKVLAQVVKSDKVNDRGLRNVLDGEIELVTGFEGNVEMPLRKAILTPYSSTIDRTAGTLTVLIPAFSPDKSLIKPEAATHFQLTSVGCEIDFETEVAKDQPAVESPYIPLSTEQQEAITLTTSIPNSTKPLFLSFGVRFAQEVNGKYYKTGNANALAIVQVDGGA